MLLTEGMAALGPCGLVSALLFQNWMCLGLGRSRLEKLVKSLRGLLDLLSFCCGCFLLLVPLTAQKGLP